MVDSEYILKIEPHGKFTGCPVVKTQGFHCCGLGFDPWSGNEDPASRAMQPKKKLEPMICQRVGLDIGYK